MPLLLALHGGTAPAKGAGVRGTGREALSLFGEAALAAGFLVVAPDALDWPWPSATNEKMLREVLEETLLQFDVDLDRIVVAGEGLGGEGALWFAARSGDRFAVAAAVGSDPADHAGALAARGVALWLYHGEADEAFPVAASRKAAQRLASAGADFVYLELPGLGHGFPPAAERDLWAFAAPRRRARAKGAGPASSLRLPVSAAERAAHGDPSAAWRPAEGEDEAAWLAALAAGGSGAEPAARRLLLGATEETAAAVAAVAKARSSPPAARVQAAWLLGRMRAPVAVEVLGDVVRAETDPWLVTAAAQALHEVGSPDAREDLRAALLDTGARWQRRSFADGRVPFFELDRTCRVLAAIVEAAASLGPDPDLAAQVESAAVVAVLKDGRPVAADPDAGEVASDARAHLARSCARAYRALRAEATFLDLLRSVLRADPVALEAVVQGAQEGPVRPGAKRGAPGSDG
jgi:hypothetical protein